MQELEARILAVVAARSGVLDDRDAAERPSSASARPRPRWASIPAPAGPPPTDDLKSLFRDAAKRMHPDLVQDEAGREHAEAFMKRLNQAYKTGDAEAIGNLVRQWETSPYATAAAPPAADAAPALHAAVAHAEQRLAEARDSDLARLMEQAFAASMDGRDLLAELRQDAEGRVARAVAQSRGCARYLDDVGDQAVPIRADHSGRCRARDVTDRTAGGPDMDVLAAAGRLRRARRARARRRGTRRSSARTTRPSPPRPPPSARR